MFELSCVRTAEEGVVLCVSYQQECRKVSTLGLDYAATLNSDLQQYNIGFLP